MSDLARVKSYGKNVEKLKDSYGYNEGVRGAWTPIWTRNSARNYGIIEQIFETRNADMATYRDIYQPKPTIILGSGPSQHDIRPYLKNWEGNLFISTSQIPLCAKMGIDPTACVLIDCDPAMIGLVQEYHHFFKRMVLITHPQIPREYLEAWPKDRVYFFRMLDPGDVFSNNYLGLIYGWINEKTGWCIQSTILNGGNIVNTMIPLVHNLNIVHGQPKLPIFLAGYDLGYPDGLRRCSDFKLLPDGTWQEIPAPPLTDERWKQANRQESNNGVPLDDLGVFYKTSTMILVTMANPPLVSCSRGVVTEIPYAKPEDVVAKQGVGFDHLFRTDVEAYRIGQSYLVPRGFLTLKTDFWVSVTNLASMKPFEKFKKYLEFQWYNSRPWKWMGGRGWVPWKIKRARKEQAKKEQRIKEEGRNEKH